MRSPRSLRAARDAGSTRAWYVLALAVIVGACAEPTSPPLAPGAQPHDPVVPASSVGELTGTVGLASISAGIEYTWSEGQPPTYLGENRPPVIGNQRVSSKRVCYLTRIKGKFPNWSAELAITLKGTSWYLQGVSQKMGVEGRARCAIVADYSEEYYWDDALPMTSIPHPPSNWACFLTGIGGNFDDSYTAVWIDTNGRNGEWSLGGIVNDGTTQQVWARCLKPLDGTANFVAEGGWGPGYPPQTMAPTSGNICVLYNLVGYLDDPSNYVAVVKGGTHWQLTGALPSGGNAFLTPLWGYSKCYS
jgi:hypothetical protein